MCIAQKGKNVAYDSSRGESSNHGRGRRNHRGRGGRSNQGDREERNNLHCIRCDRRGHEANTCRTPWDKIKEQEQDKNKKPESTHFIVAHCNTTIENLCNTSFASWQDAWLIDTGASCHMSFRRDFFEELNTKIDGVVYFADRSCIKP